MLHKTKNSIITIPVSISIFIFISILLFMGCKDMFRQKSVKIGVVYPFSGPTQTTGILVKDTVNMTVKEINEKGGPAGYKFKVVFADDKSKPAYASILAEKLIKEDKVDFLLGTLTSEVAVKVTEVSRQHRKIFIGAAHTSSSLMLEHFHPYYFRIRKSSFQSMAAGAMFLNELRKTKSWNTIAFIGPDYTFGYDALEELKYNLKRYRIDYKLIATYWPKFLTKNFSQYITSIIRDKPDILVIGLFASDLWEFVRQANPKNLFQKMTVCNFESGDIINFLKIMKDDAPLHMYISASYHVNWPETAENLAFAEKIKQSMGINPTVVIHDFYNAVNFIARAIEKTGDPGNTDALIKAMEETKIKLPGDPDGFTSYIHPETHQIVQTVTIGEILENKNFPPATRMPGNWKVFRAEDLMPPPEYIKAKREKLSVKSSESQKKQE